MPVALDAQPGRNGLAGGNSQFEWFVGSAWQIVSRNALRVGFQGDEHFGFTAQLDLSKIIHFFGNFFTTDDRLRGHFRERSIRFIRSGGVNGGVDRCLGFALAGLDNEGRRNREPGRKAFDINLDFAIELIYPLDVDGKTLAAAGINGGICSIEGDFEIRFRFAHVQTINETLAAEAARIGHANKIGAIHWRSEVHT